ncbi:uncharacterized protein LOC126857060 isoform X1 [Cataglyphis hispanica]|uniref:uncharacterized protein LOC126857060 isoform X1 n=1 Tax=Cataglyphis hispanica TaxID=1086592 RepID=UPI0021803571|nr:uncharacterized protein LOC126857060 isoform X1 [Cataglyphis hispanica]
MHKMQSDLQMPYLRAIQAVPGNTASQKLCWIEKLTSYRASGDPEQLPQELLPILRTEIAVNEKKYEDITTALKSEDWTIVNRAFKAAWFFDGSHKNIVNAEYFCEHVFPYVSMNTRGRIVITLANRLTDPELAQQLFTKVASTYGIYNAYPLIAACDEAFVYKTVEQQKLVLPLGTVKKIFRKNPDLIVRYLKLLKPVNATERPPFPVDIHKYKFLLPKLVKKRPDAFAELIEMHEANPPKIILSNTCAEIFLKKGQRYLIKKPRLYIKILPLKKISKELIESIFISLLPAKNSCFDTDRILKYLQYYPQNERYKLLRESYMAKYGTELLDEDKNVTPALLRVLPAKERIEQARIKLEKEKLQEVQYNNMRIEYERAWICYLPVNEVIPVIKEKISKASVDVDRLDLIFQMFYACKINENDDALIDSLKYFLNRHKNEEYYIFQRTMEHLLQLFDISQLNEGQNSLLFEITKLFYVKYERTVVSMIEAIIHFRLIHNMPINELIRMLINTKKKWSINFSLLKKYPQYERKCLATFAEIIQENQDSWLTRELDYQKYILCPFVEAMYDFNERCKKSGTKIERMTIKNYDWLLNNIRDLLSDSERDLNIWKILQKWEPELFRSLYRPKELADVKTGEALALLKQNPQDILRNWKKYLVICKKQHLCTQVQRFVKATRWYKDIPIRFVNHCMNYLHKHKEYKDTDEVTSILTILAILLHGDTLTKLIEPLIPTETTINASHPDARKNYKLVRHLPLIMRLSNPPVPLELVAKLCEGDYLTIALATLTNVSRRSCLPKVLSFASKLYKMRVGARKHGVRLMYQIAPTDELTEFLREMWTLENHHSIRQVIFEAVRKLLSMAPNPANWSLYCLITRTVRLKDEALLSQMKLLPSFPNEYVSKYFEIWLEIINDFELLGLDVQKTNKYIISFLEQITVPVCNLLSENFAQDIIKKYLFIIDVNVSEAARSFSMLYLFPKDETKFTIRSKEFIDILHSVLKTHWDTTYPKKSCFFPYNNALHLFVEDFVVSYVNRFRSNKSTDMQFIDDMLKIFSSVLVPTQDVRSYLLLTYAKKLQECTSTNKCFGLQFGQHLPELVEIFSPSLVYFMSEILDHFLNRVFEDYTSLEEFKLTVIEGLIKADNTDSCFMAVTMLSPMTSKNLVTRYKQLIVKFREMKNPAIISILYDHLNTLNFGSIVFD